MGKRSPVVRLVVRTHEEVLASVHDRWRTLDRGWRATVLSLGAVAAAIVV